MSPSPHEHESRHTAPEVSDLPHCVWCGLVILTDLLSMTEDNGTVRTYHGDCYRYGLHLDPEAIGWRPIPYKPPSPSGS
ncbi:MAG: hypothetical protein U1B94_00660 [candidate division NC10 bacterium]|nr:hypothetical protein [candidate division NC10 bacterium]